MLRKLNLTKLMLVALACGGAPLVTAATCNPNTGFVRFFRDDDSGDYDDYYYDDYYYDGYYDYGYYDDYYYDDCGYYSCY